MPPSYHLSSTVLSSQTLGVLTTNEKVAQGNQNGFGVSKSTEKKSRQKLSREITLLRTQRGCFPWIETPTLGSAIDLFLNPYEYFIKAFHNIVCKFCLNVSSPPVSVSFARVKNFFPLLLFGMQIFFSFYALYSRLVKISLLKFMMMRTVSRWNPLQRILLICSVSVLRVNLHCDINVCAISEGSVYPYVARVFVSIRFCSVSMVSVSQAWLRFILNECDSVFYQTVPQYLFPLINTRVSLRSGLAG